MFCSQREEMSVIESTACFIFLNNLEEVHTTDYCAKLFYISWARLVKHSRMDIQVHLGISIITKDQMCNTAVLQTATAVISVEYI